MIGLARLQKRTRSPTLWHLLTEWPWGILPITRVILASRLVFALGDRGRVGRRLHSGFHEAVVGLAPLLKTLEGPRVVEVY